MYCEMRFAPRIQLWIEMGREACEHDVMEKALTSEETKQESEYPVIFGQGIRSDHYI